MNQSSTEALALDNELKEIKEFLRELREFFRGLDHIPRCSNDLVLAGHILGWSDHFLKRIDSFLTGFSHSETPPGTQRPGLPVRPHILRRSSVAVDPAAIIQGEGKQ